MSFLKDVSSKEEFDIEDISMDSESMDDMNLEDINFEEMLNNMQDVSLDDIVADHDNNNIIDEMFEELDSLEMEEVAEIENISEAVQVSETQMQTQNPILPHNDVEIVGMEMEANTTPFEDTTTITKGTKFTGNIITDGALAVLGSIIGDVDCAGKLVVTGVIEGNVKAIDFFASNARVDGNVDSENSIKIGTGTVLIGNIAAKSATVAGAIKGDLNIDGPVVLDGTAVIIGNITASTLQVNNGAVFEGHCGLTNSQIDLDTYFDKKSE